MCLCEKYLKFMYCTGHYSIRRYVCTLSTPSPSPSKTKVVTQDLSKRPCRGKMWSAMCKPTTLRMFAARNGNTATETTLSPCIFSEFVRLLFQYFNRTLLGSQILQYIGNLTTHTLAWEQVLKYQTQWTVARVLHRPVILCTCSKYFQILTRANPRATATLNHYREF